jgi:transposase
VGRPHIYPEEFRREACELVRRGDRSQRQIAADLGIPDQTLNNWMKSENKAKVRAKDPNALTESELAELKRLRKENAALKTDREILFKAAAFFARETDR